MTALGVDLADVKLAQASAESLQDGGGFAHGGIDLAGVADVETEGRVRQTFEDFNQIAGGLSDGLALVHVLDAETVAQARPLLRPIHHVRVHDYGPAPAQTPEPVPTWRYRKLHS